MESIFSIVLFCATRHLCFTKKYVKKEPHISGVLLEIKRAFINCFLRFATLVKSPAD